MIVATSTPTQPDGEAHYFYDGDGCDLRTPERSERGNLVLSIIDGVTTYYPSAQYERKTKGSQTIERKYYSAGSVRIAMRENETLTWLFTDHLGSVSVTADASGNLLSSIKYTAFGEIRAGESTTDYKYTGQRNEIEIGLYYRELCAPERFV